MTEIAVECNPAPDGWSCKVRLSEGRSATEHTVRVTAAVLNRFAPGAREPTEVVKRSFAFLLEREPRESILRSFDLPLIGRYFPEYEATIIGRDV